MKSSPYLLLINMRILWFRGTAVMVFASVFTPLLRRSPIQVSFFIFMDIWEMRE